MAVQEFECQIARSQIGRYLAGEGLSSETLRQLGSHVAECGGCKDYLDLRKNALQNQLEEPESAKPLVEATSGGSKASETLISKLREQAKAHRLHLPESEGAEVSVATVQEPAEAFSQAVVDRAENPKTKLNIDFKQSKPFVLGGCLVGVLYFMNMMVHGPNSLLGPKASTVVHEVSAASNVPAAISSTPQVALNSKSTAHDAAISSAIPQTNLVSKPSPTAIWKEASFPVQPQSESKATRAPDKLVASALPKQDVKFIPAKSDSRAQTFAPLRPSSAAKKSASAPEGSLITLNSNSLKGAVAPRKSTKSNRKSKARHWRRRPGTGTIRIYDLGN